MNNKKVWGITIIMGILTLIFMNKLIFMIIYNPNNLKIYNKKDTYIFGSSHAQCALNDEIIENSINLSRQAENMFFTYNKMKLFFDCNKDTVKKAVLVISPYVFSEKGDMDFKGDLGLQYYGSYYKSITEDEELEVLKEKNFSKYMWVTMRYKVGIISPNRRELEILFKMMRNSNNIVTSFPFISGYNGNKKHIYKPEKNVSKYHFHYYKDENELEESKLMKKYFYKIVDMCKEKNINLILIDTPKHRDYLSVIPQDFQERYENIVRDVLLKNSNVVYYNLSARNLQYDCYIDANHVNSKGAEIVSKFINEEIKKQVK